jgi:hypothetical protein
VAAVVERARRDHDKNAVRVEIHDKLVGYIDRDEANEIQSWLRGLEKAGTPAYVLARLGGRRVEQGRVGPIGVTIEAFPDVFDGGT